MIDFLFALFTGVMAIGIKAVFAFGLIYFALNYVNDKHNIRLKEDILDVVKQDPRAAAQYYGDRLKSAGMVILGICIGSL